MLALFPLKMAHLPDTTSLEYAMSRAMSDALNHRGYWYEVKLKTLRDDDITAMAKSWNDTLKKRVMDTALQLKQDGLPKDVINDLHVYLNDLVDLWSHQSPMVIFYDALLVCQELDFGFYDVRTVMLDEILNDILKHPKKYAIAEIAVKQEIM